MNKEDIVNSIYRHIIRVYEEDDVSISEVLASLTICDDEGEFVNETWVSYFSFEDLIEAAAKARFDIDNDITAIINLEEDTAVSDQISINSVCIEDHGSNQHAVTFMTEKSNY